MNTVGSVEQEQRVNASMRVRECVRVCTCVRSRVGGGGDGVKGMQLTPRPNGSGSWARKWGLVWRLEYRVHSKAHDTRFECVDRQPSSLSRPQFHKSVV